MSNRTLEKPQIPLDLISWAKLLPYAEIASNRNKDEELWKVDLNTENGACVGYLRICSEPHAIIAEACSAMLGRALKLPVPQPFLVRVERQELPNSVLWRKNQTHMIGFASSEASGESFAQLLNRNSVEAKKLFLAWKRFPEVVAFDEWIANIDRNAGNLIYHKKDFWLIDHADALTGAKYWMLWGLNAPDQSCANLLYDDHVPNCSPEQCHDLQKIAKACVERYSRLALQDISAINEVSQLVTDQTLESIISFLEQRIQHTAALVCQRLLIQQTVTLGGKTQTC